MRLVWGKKIFLLNRKARHGSTQIFSREFCEIFKKAFLKNSLGGCLWMNDTHFTIYAGDNTHYATTSTIDEITNRLENHAAVLFKWSSNYKIKAN